MSNKELVLKYMQDFGSITTLDAFKDLGYTRLSDAIYCLKKDGYNIGSTTECSKNRYGKKVYYSRYYIMEEEK